MGSARDYGLTVTGTSAGEELVLCPFHADRSASAWYNPRSNLFYCASCGLGLNSYQLAKRLGVEVALSDFDEEEREPEDFDLVHVDLCEDLGERRYVNYFQKRHISEETACNFDARYKGSEPEAIVFPLRDLHHRVVGVQHRYLHPEATGTRYKTFGTVPPLWPLERLYGLPVTTVPIVVEGAWSAMRMHTYASEHGVDIAVFALLGAKARQETLDILAPWRCIFLYDGDTAGKRARRQLLNLAPLAQAYTVPVSPDDMDDGQLFDLFVKIYMRLEESESWLTGTELPTR